MSTNIFGRNTEDNKYEDLYASVKRIVEKSERKEEARGFKNISSHESLTNVQDTIRQMYNKKDDEDVSPT